ncbi:helix-turn-helix transcriptional regulator [Halorubrum vacuolatum]|nr:transcriptional regulator [Halorubrum vacuolatum]
MSEENPRDGIRYLSGSPARVAILRTIRREPRRPAAITDEIEATRTTVQRVLAGFRERRWVVTREGDYHMTPAGERVHDAYESLLEEVELADRVGRFAADLERADAGFPAEGLTCGELTVADGRDPLAAVDRVVEIIREAAGEEVQAISPIVTRRYNEAAAGTLDHGARIRLVIDKEVMAASVAEFTSATERALEDEDATVLVAAEPVEYGLFTRGDHVCVVTHDDRNSPRCVFESRDPIVRTWAEERFERYCDGAKPLTEVIDGMTENRSSTM